MTSQKELHSRAQNVQSKARKFGAELTPQVMMTSEVAANLNLDSSFRRRADQIF